MDVHLLVHQIIIPPLGVWRSMWVQELPNPIIVSFHIFNTTGPTPKIDVHCNLFSKVSSFEVLGMLFVGEEASHGWLIIFHCHDMYLWPFTEFKCHIIIYNLLLGRGTFLTESVIGFREHLTSSVSTQCVLHIALVLANFKT